MGSSTNAANTTANSSAGNLNAQQSACALNETRLLEVFSLSRVAIDSLDALYQQVRASAAIVGTLRDPDGEGDDDDDDGEDNSEEFESPLHWRLSGYMLQRDHWHSTRGFPNTQALNVTINTTLLDGETTTTNNNSNSSSNATSNTTTAATTSTTNSANNTNKTANKQQQEQNSTSGWWLDNPYLWWGNTMIGDVNLAGSAKGYVMQERVLGNVTSAAVQAAAAKRDKKNRDKKQVQWQWQWQQQRVGGNSVDLLTNSTFHARSLADLYALPLDLWALSIRNTTANSSSSSQ